MRNYVYPSVEHVMKVTDFKDKSSAEAAIKTLKWLDNGAPHKVRSLPKNVHFSMDNFILSGDCGTSCCIAGAMVQFATKTYHGGNTGDIWGVFYETFNMEITDQLDKLFYGTRTLANDFLPEIKYYEAATALRNYLKKGKVSWKHLKKEKLLARIGQ